MSLVSAVCHSILFVLTFFNVGAAVSESAEYRGSGPLRDLFDPKKGCGDNLGADWNFDPLVRPILAHEPGRDQK